MSTSSTMMFSDVIVMTWFKHVARRYSSTQDLETYVLLDLRAITQYLCVDVKDSIFSHINQCHLHDVQSASQA